MNRQHVATLVVAAVLGVATPWTFAQNELPGVTGQLTLLEKNKNNAAAVDKVKIHVDDEVEITWTYPIVPGAIPTKVSARSSDAAVKFDAIVRVNRPRIVGAGVLAAYFTGKKAGSATITFEISNGQASTVVECQVEVVE